MLKIQEIREIIQLIDESSIHEFTYEVEGAKISLLKKQAASEVVQVPKVLEPAVEQKVSEAVQQTNAVVDSVHEPNVQVTVDYDYEIVSPMVGTLYSASSPEHEPFVTEGSTIAKGSVVCIVEAMKLFNEIESDVAGEIVEVLVDNGELVEYGQPLYRVKTK